MRFIGVDFIINRVKSHTAKYIKKYGFVLITRTAFVTFKWQGKKAVQLRQ